MSEELHVKIVGFLRVEFARREGRSCNLVELTHCPTGQRPETLRVWDRKETPELFDELSAIEGLTSEILRIASDHAESFGTGNCRYEIRTTQHLGGRAKHGFRIRVEGDDGVGDDPPTERGLVGQLMRHNEANTRLLAQSIQVTISTMNRTISDLSEQNRELVKDRRDHMRELEEARSEQAERDLEGMRQVAADKRKDAAFDKIMGLVPVAASRFLGGGKVEEGANAAGAMAILATELASSLTDEQKARLFQLLSNSQKVLLVELINKASQHVPGQAPGQPGQPPHTNGVQEQR